MTLKIEIYSEGSYWDTFVTEVEGKSRYLIESSLEGFVVEGFSVTEGRQTVPITDKPTEINFVITGAYCLDEDVTEIWNRNVVKSYFAWKNICCDCAKLRSSVLVRKVNDVMNIEHLSLKDNLCVCCPGRGCGDCDSCMNPDTSLTSTIDEAIDLYEDLCK
jgi:hypothetical protein